MMGLSVVLMAALACQAQAKAVFSHYMVSNAANLTSKDWDDDISLAQSAKIDGFALNIARGDDSLEKSLDAAFSAAKKANFKVFLSFDYKENSAWAMNDVSATLKKYTNESAYYNYNKKPLVTTIDGAQNNAEWKQIKEQTDIFFMPDWSSLGPKEALEKDGLADGLFNGDAWPSGASDMNTTVDESYKKALDGKPYMMAVSPWYYINLPEKNENEIRRGDDLWYDRWQQVSDVSPDFVQIISWNDFAQSSYVGPLRDGEYGVFTTGKAKYNYASGMPHDGWRVFLPSVIADYKGGDYSIDTEELVAWYRLNPKKSCKDGNTTTSEHGGYSAPDVVEDKIFYSALLSSSATISVSIGGMNHSATFQDTPKGGSGIYHGSVSTNGQKGEVIVEISRDGDSIAKLDGNSITSTCKDDLNNWNAWVGSQKASESVKDSKDGKKKSFGVSGKAGVEQLVQSVGLGLIVSLFLFFA